MLKNMTPKDWEKINMLIELHIEKAFGELKREIMAREHWEIQEEINKIINENE